MFVEAVEIYRPPLSPWLIVGLIIAAVVGALVVYAQAARHGHVGRATVLTGLRLTALAAVAWILAGPSVLRSDSSAGIDGARPGVTLLVDTSASMMRRDVGSLTRWEAIAEGWLDPLFLRTLGEQARVEVRGFDEAVHPLDIETAHRHAPEGQATHLLSAVDQLTHHRETSRALDVLVVLSDGRDTHAAMNESLRTDLSRRGVTLFAVPVGAPHAGPHLALQAWPEADVLHEGQSTIIHGTISQHDHDGQTVLVDLYHENNHIDQQRLTFDDDQTSKQVRFEITPPGPGPRSVVTHHYKLRVHADSNGQSDDASLLPDHQREHVFIQTSRERIRVVLLEGQPYWDTRFLGHVLQRDPRIELTAVYALGDDRRLHITDEDARPLDLDALDRDTLDHFDIVILGKQIERFLPDDRARWLSEYVTQRGGALVLARGQPFDVTTEPGRRAMTELESVVPVTWGQGQLNRLRLALTPEGRESPLVSLEDAADATDMGDADMSFTQLPEMIAATRIEGTSAASVVLLRQAPADAQMPEMAALVHGRAGRGHVLAVLSDGLWRWALLADDEQAQRGVYETFWRRAMRWLAADGEFLPGQDVTLSLDRTMIEPDEPVRVTVATRHVQHGFEPALMVVGPDNEPERVTLERAAESAMRWHGVVRPAQDGIHRLELRAPDQPDLIPPQTPIISHLAVRRQSIETLDTAARPEVLKALAEATGGERWALDERDRLLEYVNTLQQVRRHEPEPAYDFARWPALLIIVVGLGLEWFLRRRNGWL